MPVVTDTGADLLLPFQIEAGSVRGRLVRLGPALDAAVGVHDLPVPVGARLAETVVLGGALAGALKYDGVFTLQIQAEGAIPLLVADVTSDGDLRAYARFDDDRLTEARARDELAPVPRYFGKGYLAFTVDQGPDTERYQGLVALDGETLSVCTESYLSQSEQLASAVVTAVAPPGNGRGWRAAALIIQRMPQGPASPILTAETAEEDWNRAVILMKSVQDSELLDPDLPPETLLRRLFHAEGLILHEPRALQARCRCSEERVRTTLRSFAKTNLDGMKDEDGVIAVTCEFCKARYIFTDRDLEPSTP